MEKNTARLICVLLAVILVASLMPQTVSAATLDYTATAGEYASFRFYENYDEEVQSASIDNGGISGMSLTYPNPAAVALSGTPSVAGYYTLYVSVYLQNGEWLQFTLNVDVKEAPAAPPAVDEIPVITKHPGSETVTETDSAVFTVHADHTSQYMWELLTADGKTVAGEKLEVTFPGLKAGGYGSDRLVLDNIPLSLNGCKVRCCFVGTAQSVYSNYATITVKAAKDATPVVTKNPTSEWVKEGGLCQFVARAKYAQYYGWELISPDGTCYEADTLEGLFEGLKVSGEYSDTLTLRNIPAELDGYRARCKFFSASVTASAPAYLYVIPNPETTEATEATEAPTEAATEAPTEPETVPTEAATEAPTEPPVQTEAPAPEAQTPEAEDGNSGVAPVAIVSGAAVAIAAIAAFVILKLKKR